MFTIKNGLNSINTSGSYKRFVTHYSLRGKKSLKRILTFLYCNKYNEVNIFHSDIQKRVSYNGHTKDF